MEANGDVAQDIWTGSQIDMQIDEWRGHGGMGQ